MIYLPEIAASERIRVVSWKDAAEIKLSVPKEACVIPIKIGFAVAARLLSAFTRRIDHFKVNTVNTITNQEISISWINNTHFT